MGEEGGLQGQRWDHPGGYAPAPKSLPSSLTSPRKKTPGRDRPPAPRCVFGEEPRDRGSSRLRRGACSQRRHRAGASWVGRGPLSALRSTPGPSLQKSRDGAARVSTAAGQAPVRWEANPRKAGRSSPLTFSEKSRREGSEAGGARKGRGERGRGVEGPGPGLPPGPKALLLPNARIPGKCSRPRLCRRRRRAAGRAKSVALLVTGMWGR